MKNYIKQILLAAVIFTFLISLQSRTYAQCMTAAVNPDNAAGIGTLSVGNTGNDIKTSGALGTMEVYVWDDYSGTYGSGLGWSDLTAGWVGTIPLISIDARDPDVTLVESGGTWYAVVAYYSPGAAGYFCDFYMYTGTAFVPAAHNPIPACAVFGSAINIDGDDRGDFAIIYDNACTGSIYLVGGTSSAGAPVFCGGAPTPVILPGTLGDKDPDVSCYNMGTVSLVYYTYLNGPRNKIMVGFDKFGWLCGGTLLNNNLFSNFLAAGYYQTRIATPPTGTATGLDWSVAVWSNYDILGYNSTTGILSAYNYTNGTSFPFCTLMWNKRPAISYDNLYGGLMVGWVSADNTYSPILNPMSNVALQCAVNGAPVAGYLVVPFVNNFAASQDDLSIAGRDESSGADLMAYAYYDNSSFDMLYKTVAFGSVPLRKSGSGDASSIGIYPVPFSNSSELGLTNTDPAVNYSLKLTDISGQVLLEVSGKSNEINRQLNELNKNLDAGIYMVHLNSDDNKIVRNQKLVKI